MKLPRNLEAAFLAVAVAANFASYAVAEAHAADVPVASAVRASSEPAPQQMHVVVVKAQRLTAAEKAALD